MIRTYEHHGFTLEVTVESDFTFHPVKRTTAMRSPYVAVVRVSRADDEVAIFSPLRFDEAGGRPFNTEVDALMGGYSQARRIVDNLFPNWKSRR